MGTGPAYRGPGRDPSGLGDPLWDGTWDWGPAQAGADWMDDPEIREAYLAALAEEDEPDDPDQYQDPDSASPPGLDDAQLAALIAEARELNGAQSGAAWPGSRRGPGMPGSGRRFPGESAGPAAGFGSGRELDTAPGCAVLALFAGDAAGDDDRYQGASEDELVGAICAWDRVEAHASARKHAAVAELIRRRPADGCEPEGLERVPSAWEEFTPVELAPALGESRGGAEGLLGLALDLAALLPGTAAAFRSGIINADKAATIARATETLDPAEARAAEAMVLGRAGRLTPGGLRAAIARAVTEVAPGKARQRREQAARLARVERWGEDSGNAGLAGRELPPAEVLAADQRVTWWARQLKAAGLAGDMDQLRARAYLDILLGIDSRPARGDPDAAGPGPAALGGPRARPIPPGFAGKVNLTIPLVTLLGLADRPGEIPGIGPIEPALARDLAAAAARSPRTTWCVTVTDQDGHAIGHGCARPAPGGTTANRAKPVKSDIPGGPSPPGGPGPRGGPSPPCGPALPGGPGPPGGHDASGRLGDGARPGFTFGAGGQHGPPGGYGTWRLRTGRPGERDLIVALGPIAIHDCDHRHEAAGHDPGVMLRHLTQIRQASCTGPACRRPATRCDFEHNTPFEAGGRTCECNGGPKCRYDHRLKQHPRWKAEQPSPGVIVWTTPAGRRYTTEPTRYPI